MPRGEAAGGDSQVQGSGESYAPFPGTPPGGDVGSCYNQKGRCLIDIFNDDHELLATRELFPGDLMLMVGGGHGFRMSEDTVLLEVKQGPYTGIDEKQRF